MDRRWLGEISPFASFALVGELMEVAQAVDERLDVIERKEVQWLARQIEAKTVPPIASRSAAAHRAEIVILAISELGHLLTQFSDGRRAMPRCPISTRDQIERHRSSALNWSRLATLAVGVAVMLASGGPACPSLAYRPSHRAERPCIQGTCPPSIPPWHDP